MSTQIALLVARVVADTSQFDKKMLTTNRIMGGVGKAGLLMAGGVAAGIGLAVHEAGNFQESMNVLQAITHGTTGQMNAMRKEAIALGADLKLPNTSAQDAADTLGELAKGGFSVKQAMEAARGTIQLATAAQISNADAAKIEANALFAFHLRATNAAHVADMLANAANASTGDISDMALAVQQAGGVFAGAGQHLDTLTTAVALLANNGVKGEVAGTALKQSMLQLAVPTKAATAEMHKLGLKVADAHGNFLPFRSIVGQLADETKNMGTQTREAALKILFGSSGVKVMNGLIRGGLPAWDAMHKKIERAGSAQAIAQAHTKGLNGAWQGFISTLQTTAIQIGTLFLPMFTKMFKEMSTFMAFLGKHNTTMKTLAITIFSIGTAMVLLTGIYKIYMTATKLIEFYQMLFSKSLIVTRIQLMALAVWTRIVTAAQWLLNIAMDANPIMLVVIALIAIGVALYEAYKHSATFREIINSLWGDLKDFASWVGNVFTKLIPRAFHYVVAWLKANWVNVVLFLVGGPFLVLAKKAIDAFGLVGKIKSAFNTIVSNIKSWASAVVNFLSSLPDRFANWGSKMGGKLASAIIAGVRGIGSTLVGIIKGAINSVINVWNGLRIPGFSYGIHKGPLDFSVGIPAINLPDIPHVASGGFVSGPTLAIVGDNRGGTEAIVPLPERADMLHGGSGVTINLTVNGSVITERDLEEKLLDVLTTYGRRNGRVRLATASSI